MEISTNEGVLQCCTQHAGWDGWVACKLELVQVAAGGDLQSKKPCWTVAPTGTNTQTNRPHCHMQKDLTVTEQNGTAPPAPSWIPAKAAWGEPKRVRRSVPTQPPTCGHLLGISTAALARRPCFLATFQDKEAGSLSHPVLYLLWYYLPTGYWQQ